jgi:chromosome segregation ATPase
MEDPFERFLRFLRYRSESGTPYPGSPVGKLIPDIASRVALLNNTSQSLTHVDEVLEEISRRPVSRDYYSEDEFVSVKVAEHILLLRKSHDRLMRDLATAEAENTGLRRLLSDERARSDGLSRSQSLLRSDLETTHIHEEHAVRDSYLASQRAADANSEIVALKRENSRLSERIENLAMENESLKREKTVQDIKLNNMELKDAKGTRQLSEWESTVWNMEQKLLEAQRQKTEEWKRREAAEIENKSLQWEIAKLREEKRLYAQETAYAQLKNASISAEVKELKKELVEEVVECEKLQNLSNTLLAGNREMRRAVEAAVSPIKSPVSPIRRRAMYPHVGFTSPSTGSPLRSNLSASYHKTGSISPYKGTKVDSLDLFCTATP